MTIFRRPRAAAMLRHCPKCGAVPGKPCLGRRKDPTAERTACHVERHAARAAAKKRYHKSPTDPRWQFLRAKVFAEKGSQCAYCGADANHVDHQVPKSRGGSDDLSNLVPSCSPCNLSKGNKTLEEWLQ